jgi:hypothetical protein
VLTVPPQAATAEKIKSAISTVRAENDLTIGENGPENLAGMNLGIN